MKYYLFIHNLVKGPYSPEEILKNFGGLAPGTMVCVESEADKPQPDWRTIQEFPDLAVCIKSDIIKPISERELLDKPGTPIRILSTDDDDNIRSLLWDMLTGAGHVVDFAKDGEEVFKRMDGSNYDLLILDVNMPKMNGYKVSKLVHKKYSKPPKIIIFTGREITNEKLQFICSEADAIINKGTGNEQLLQTINQLFSRKTARKPSADTFTPEPQPQTLGAQFAIKDSSFADAEQAKKAISDRQQLIQVPPPVKATQKPAPAVAEMVAVPPDVSARTKRVNQIANSAEQLTQQNKSLQLEMVSLKATLAKLEARHAKEMDEALSKVKAENKTLLEKLAAERKKIGHSVNVKLFVLIAALAVFYFLLKYFRVF